MLNQRSHRHGQRGGTLIEVLISILIVSFGLMALAGLQTTMNAALLESYQRTQALTLMQDMVQRMEANQANAIDYVNANPSPFGTGESAACTAAALPGASRAVQDQCEWSNLLKGASELAGTTSVGAMIGGRGCIELVQATDASSGVCQPGIYRVSVAWQGLTTTVAPPGQASCAQNQYTDEKMRRVIATHVLVPLPNCS